MDFNTENIQRITGNLKSLNFASAIGIAFFNVGAEEIILYGESRMMRPLEYYVGRNLVLCIKSEYDWSWLPIDENNPMYSHNNILIKEKD